MQERRCMEMLDLGEKYYANKQAKEEVFQWKTVCLYYTYFEVRPVFNRAQEEHIWNVFVWYFLLHLSSGTMSKVRFCILFTIKHLKRYQLHRPLWLAAYTRDNICSLPSPQSWMSNIFHCCILKMTQNGSKPKGKYLIIVLQTIKWWEISCDSFSQRS